MIFVTLSYFYFYFLLIVHFHFYRCIPNCITKYEHLPQYFLEMFQNCAEHRTRCGPSPAPRLGKCIVQQHGLTLAFSVPKNKQLPLPTHTSLDTLLTHTHTRSLKDTLNGSLIPDMISHLCVTIAAMQHQQDVSDTGSSVTLELKQIHSCLSNRDSVQLTQHYSTATPNKRLQIHLSAHLSTQTHTHTHSHSPVGTCRLVFLQDSLPLI